MAGALALGPPGAAAQDARALRGTFVWDSTAGDDVAGAIEFAIADLGFLHRRFARGHLHRANEPYRTVTIEQDDDTVSIATDGGEPIRAPSTGEPIEWTRGDGERMRVSIAREDSVVRQTFTAGDEARENLFRPHADGRGLTMTVTVRLDRLPHPIRYELVYRRDEDSRLGQYLWDVVGPEGGRTLALPRIAGAYAGAFAELAWTPVNADASDALISGTAFIVASAIGNLVQEFVGAIIPLPGVFAH